MTETQFIGVAVDAYSTGNFLPAAFARHGAKLIHVQSTPALMPSMLAPNMNEYLENIVFDNEANTVQRLGRHQPVCVIAGQEPGVPLADRLSELLGLPSNGSALSPARRNKYEMIETLRANDIRCAEQFKADNAEEILAWVRETHCLPCVVKPLSSASTDGVVICHNEDEVLAAARQVLASRDIFGLANREVLVQSYLDGVEYIVDTVSAYGRHYVCGIWRYEKRLISGGKNIYDKDILVAEDAPEVAPLIHYIHSVLDALGIEFGPCHAEVMLTQAGPALVEVGARLNGNMHPDFHNGCLGHNQADLIAQSYVTPGLFAEHFGGRHYRKRQEAIVFNVATNIEGTVVGLSEQVVAQINALPSVFLASYKVKPGQQLRPTQDLLSSPIRVFMRADNYEDILRDYDVINRLKHEVYVLR